MNVIQSPMKLYGTVLRCYDNGGKSCDRYTIVPPRWAKQHVEESITRYRGVRTFEAIAASAEPFHPQGFGMHVSAVPGKHLGKRVHWDALPADVQRFARKSFPDFAPIGDNIVTMIVHRKGDEESYTLSWHFDVDAEHKKAVALCAKYGADLIDTCFRKTKPEGDCITDASELKTWLTFAYIDKE